MNRVEQIRAAHKSARPNPSVNPSWFNCYKDAEFLLAKIDALQAQVDAVTSDDAVLRACAAHKGHGGMVSLWTTNEVEAMRAAIRAALGESK
jgi:hypothetical protein